MDILEDPSQYRVRREEGSSEMTALQDGNHSQPSFLLLMKLAMCPYLLNMDSNPARWSFHAHFMDGKIESKREKSLDKHYPLACGSPIPSRAPRISQCTSQ